jgi:hypothetical protein
MAIGEKGGKKRLLFIAAMIKFQKNTPPSKSLTKLAGRGGKEEQ